MIGIADYPQDLYLARGAEQAGAPHVDETAEVRWVPLGEAQAMIASGDILGAITVIGVQHAPAAAGRRSATSAVRLPHRRTSARGPQPPHQVAYVTDAAAEVRPLSTSLCQPQAASAGFNKTGHAR
jgi:hypothetical protein